MTPALELECARMPRWTNWAALRMRLKDLSSTVRRCELASVSEEHHLRRRRWAKFEGTMNMMESAEGASWAT